MPSPLTAEEVNSKTDPSVSKQYDTETPIDQQFTDLYAIADGLKSSLLTTIRPSVGPVSRSMAIAKRIGPDFLYLANIHSRKFSDLAQDKTVQITFQDSSSQNWISLTGEATTVSNEDPRIKQIYSKGVNAWFGDLKDGVHTGGPEDPRMALIEVKSKYISYWKSERTKLGFAKEVTQASITGEVAETGVQRELKEEDIQRARDSGI
ncbi:MAG: hypothetical protein LQ351_001552 [Letrouitia transgressa]|nr:MAG: hypothetical protein LQ351_001552 [Letrouitia transgressa]